MPFQKGHKFGKGRPKKLKRQCDDWIANNPGKVNELLEILYQKGLDGDRDAAIYVIDRVLGRPRQEIDQRLRAQVLTWRAEDYLVAAQGLEQVKEAESRLIEQYGEENAVKQGEG